MTLKIGQGDSHTNPCKVFRRCICGPNLVILAHCVQVIASTQCLRQFSKLSSVTLKSRSRWPIYKLVRGFHEMHPWNQYGDPSSLRSQDIERKPSTSQQAQQRSIVWAFMLFCFVRIEWDIYDRAEKSTWLETPHRFLPNILDRYYHNYLVRRVASVRLDVHWHNQNEVVSSVVDILFWIKNTIAAGGPVSETDMAQPVGANVCEND